MTSQTPYTDKTSAADKSIGFDFQYYYFLWRLLTLKSGETVGLEVMDDVHTELADSRQILIQLKHTTQAKVDGTPKNLTTFDSDLWKSLSNWTKVVTDTNSGRAEQRPQTDFLVKTDFLLVSNKSYNEANSFLSAVKAFQDGNKTLADLKHKLESLKNETEDQTIKNYIQNTLALSDESAKLFFQNLRFDLGCEDIIAKCKTAIKEHKIDESKIDEVFSGLDSRIRSENFLSIKKKEKITLSFEDVYKKFRVYFDRARNDLLKIERFTGNLPDRLEDQKFIRQLLDIQDIEAQDIESMAEFTRHLLQMQNNIDEWYKQGDLTQAEIEEFKREATTRWKNEFRKAYRGNIADQDIKAKALEILDAIRKEKLPLASQTLPTDMSNGQFYSLSNTPEIGWHKDWETLYKT